MNTLHPTAEADANAVLLELLSSVRVALGSPLVGMYVHGSLAGGDFDQHSDVDFVVVTDDELSEDLFSALQETHDQIATIDSWCATQLDGSYIPQHALRHYDPTHALHPHIDRGEGERLRWMQHDSDWIIQRHTLLEQGVTVTGPAPCTLIDPIPPNELRQAVLDTLNSWFAPMLDNTTHLSTRGYQSYTVLTMCRMLYTLQYGTVVSKPVAARWAKASLGHRWVPLIERAWVGRQNPRLKAEANDLNETLEFIRFTLERSA